MDYQTFLTRVIDDGIAAAKESYKHDAEKREGAILGFKACQGLTPVELFAVLLEARLATQKAYREEAKDYWRTRCFEAEVEWVCNCVSAVLHNEGQGVIVQPTARGYVKAAKIVGLKDKAGALGQLVRQEAGALRQIGLDGGRPPGTGCVSVYDACPPLAFSAAPQERDVGRDPEAAQRAMAKADLDRPIEPKGPRR